MIKAGYYYIIFVVFYVVTRSFCVLYVIDITIFFQMPSPLSSQVPTPSQAKSAPLSPYRVGAQSHVSSPASRRRSFPGAAGFSFLFICPLPTIPFRPVPRGSSQLLGYKFCKLSPSPLRLQDAVLFLEDAEDPP